MSASSYKSVDHAYKSDLALLVYLVSYMPREALANQLQGAPVVLPFTTCAIPAQVRTAYINHIASLLLG